jgi:glucosamine kinase
VTASYLAAVDSGGTHTNVTIVLPDGKSRPIPELDRSLSGNRPDTELAAVLDDIFAAVRSVTRDHETALWISAAGYSHATRDRFERLIRKASAGFVGSIGIANDAVGLMLAHDAQLVLTIAGTGSVAVARQPSGDVVARGGNEWIVADYGSAFWIGLAGIRAAYQDLEGGPETALLHCLTEQYRPLDTSGTAKSPQALVSEIARALASLGTDTKPTIAAFAPQVTRQAELGDEEAQRIVRSAVDELAAAAARVYRELATKAAPQQVPPRFLLVGSVAYRSPFYNQAFHASLEQFLFDVREVGGHTLEYNVQLNGLQEAISLARRLAAGENLPVLDEWHPYSVFA